MALGAATCPAGAVAGLDVSKRSLDVVVLPSGRHSRLPNSPEAHSTLVAHLRKAGVGVLPAVSLMRAKSSNRCFLGGPGSR